MDKLTAQKILGVSPQASKREIKKAYAAMLRMYHPEDYPEEFQKIQEEEYRKAREELDFEKIEWKAREEKKLKEKETIAAALKDLEFIVNTPSRRHRLKSYEEFFAKEEYKEVLFMPECVEGVCQILENTWLKREVYDIFCQRIPHAGV